jgi:hypothetical protein
MFASTALFECMQKLGPWYEEVHKSSLLFNGFGQMWTPL